MFFLCLFPMAHHHRLYKHCFPFTACKYLSMTIFNSSVMRVYSFLEHSQISLTQVSARSGLSHPEQRVPLLSVSFACGYTRAHLSLAQLGKTRHFPMITFRNPNQIRSLGDVPLLPDSAFYGLRSSTGITLLISDRD